ncbi:ROK family transcriptional regulator [Streptomyces filamentosus]|uniref:ROK family transcriptional regulator n=1 Tax=Streptomyces filamentosus TaxID=67294 RepID=A0ABY4V4A2_STRFL|nr:ROK family transcriptional regulator [Streptomyces filamentosus]EWS91908.1 ROK family transcriptional regulator [Streptomyces filamentosus NRRL 11379]USC49469.1 ROK family transcriptional regulator [Streptomyces filamentosus]
MNRSRTKAPAGVNLPALRHHNAALVLDLLRAAGAEGISRLELAEGTGLTPQAVSKITARLREDGLAVGAGLRPSTGGKPRTVLRLVPDAQFAVGLHLDRDGLTAVLVDLAGRPVAVTTAPLDLGAPAERVLADAADAVRDLCAAEPHKPVLGVGVAVPGPLDHRDGVLHRVTGFPQWDGYPLRAALAERTGLPVVLDKDTNAAALALALGGAGGGDFAYLHLGTGLGAGLVLGGEVHRGARTGAGEFGHQTLQLDGPLCGCGGRGCIEALCLAAESRGDRGEAARVLGTGAANLVGLLDIDRVVLGGRTVAADEDAYVRGVRAVIEERAARGGAGAGVTVTVAGGGDRPVAEGAAQLVLAPVFGRVGEGTGERGERG